MGLKIFLSLIFGIKCGLVCFKSSATSSVIRRAILLSQTEGYIEKELLSFQYKKDPAISDCIADPEKQ